MLIKGTVNLFGEEICNLVIKRELAFLFKTNRATLCREFKRETGRTLVTFINEKKVERAKEKILTSGKTFTQIAEEMNFESIHYFTRFFKKMTGETPKEFRQKHKTEEK